MEEEEDTSSSDLGSQQVVDSRGTSVGEEDSEFEDLVAEGREEHPLVRYTRLVRDKKAELEYVYNPEVEKNKTKNMRPLWEAAKKTVDGGIKDLKMIIEERRNNTDDEDTVVLKLEVLERDLELISMKFKMHIFGASEKFSDESEKEKKPSVPISDKTNLNNDAKKSSQKDEKKLFLDSIFFKQKDLNSKLKEEDASDLKLKTVSMEAKKRVNVFLCESATKEGKLGCEPCRRTADPTDTSLPCCFNKAPGIENTQVGFLVRYAVLSCVRATEPEVREAAITNFRRLSGMDDSEAVSDIKKMVEMPVTEWQSLLRAMYRLDLESYAELVTLTKLLLCAVQCVLKTSPGCMDAIWKETIDYYRVTGLRETDIDLYHCSLIGTTGVFGYLAWFSKFVMYSIGVDAKTRKLIMLAEMWKFNTNVCPALVVIYKHGSGRFPWMEALVQNFTNLFSHLWTKSNMTREADRQRLEDWETPAASTISPGCLAVRRSVVPRLDREAKCYQCDKRLPKTAKKVYPVCFQSVHREEAFPREVATLERSSHVWARDVMGEDLVTFPRTVRLACSTNCLLRLMALVNPAIMEILEMDPRPGREPGEEDTWPDIIDGIKYFALRHLMEQHFYSREFAARRRQEQTRAILEACRDPSPPTRLLPDITRGLEDGPPMEMQQYHHNLLLHDAELKCSHERIWTGIAEFHPTKDLDLYNLEKDSDGTSKKTMPFDIQMDTCDRLDIHLQTAEQRQELANKLANPLEELDTRFLHLFHSSLSAIPVEFLRESCHKLVLDSCNSGGLRKVFSHLLDKDVQCLLGIWTVDMDRKEVDGLIVCKNPKTFYAFKPKDPQLFWKILTEGINKEDVYRYVNIMLEGLTARRWGNNSTEIGALPNQMLAVSTLKAFSILRMDSLRLRLVSRLSEAEGECRFIVAQSGAHDWSKEPNVLLDGSNGTSRFTAKHLVGCPHSLKWQGTVWLEKYTQCGDNDDWSSTGWALECRENNSPQQLGRAGKQVPSKFWGMLPSELFILTLSSSLIESFESEELCAILNPARTPGRFPKFILELGSVPKNCLEDMKNDNVITFSLVSENRVPRYIVTYELVDGKIHSSVEDIQKHVDAFYLAVKRHHFDILAECRLFGEVGRRQENGEVTFKVNLELEPRAHNQCQGYQDKSLGNVLWTGELELCFLHQCEAHEQQHKVAGMTRHKELYGLLQHSICEAKNDCNEEGDLGSVRNCAFVSPTNHHTFSTYATVVTDHTLPQGNKELMELFSNKSKMDNPSLVAFNVERKIVENVIGTFKKCFFFYLHIQDSFYIHKEMKDLKSTMVAFFLQPQELISDLMQLPAAMLGPRLLLLRYDHRMGVLVAYVPKERGKGQQLWQKLAEDRDNLVRDHERLWRKVTRPEPERPAKDSKPGKRTLEKGWTSDVATDLRKKIELVGGRISQKETEALFESFEALVEPKKMNAQERFDLAISVNTKVTTTTSTLNKGARPKDVQATDPRKCKPTVEHKDDKIRENKKAKTPDDIKVVEGAESLTVPPELLAALAGPGGDKDKIINSMKSMGINLGSGSSMSTTMTMTASISASGLSSVTSLASMDAAATGSEEASVRKLLESMEETDEDLNEPKKTKRKQKKVKKKRGSVDKSPKENGTKELSQEDLAAAQPDPEKICWACRKLDTTTKLSKCRGCRKARYCSPECQQTDWKRHGEYCRGVAARNKERMARKAGEDIVTID